MGMPITGYTILSALAKGEDGFEINNARRVLSPFNLFAFVIHDPATHDKFHNTLTQMFDELDHITGKKLLFFAFVTPPDIWLRHARSREYYLEFASWENSRATSNDCSVTAFSIATALKIPFEDLPCIVVTSSFELKQFEWFKTSSDTLEKQLSKLGYLAARRPRGSNILHELQLDVEPNVISLNCSLTEALVDVLCFVEAGMQRDSWIREMALEQASRTLANLFKQISELKSRYSDPDSDEIDRLSICISTFLSQIYQGNLLDHNSPLINNVAGYYLENKSIIMLHTAEKVFMLLNDRKNQEVLHSLGIDCINDVDFSPAIICFAKVFENEMNLSVVHWIRQRLGIQLPEYFNLPQRGIRAVYTPSIEDGHEINFNTENQGKWLPPGIGQSELVCSDMGKTSIPAEFDLNLWAFLLAKWQIIRKKRNKAAHTEILGLEEMQAIRNALLELASQNLFAQTYSMKNHYKGISPQQTTNRAEFADAPER